MKTGFSLIWQPRKHIIFCSYLATYLYLHVYLYYTYKYTLFTYINNIYILFTLYIHIIYIIHIYDSSIFSPLPCCQWLRELIVIITFDYLQNICSKWQVSYHKLLKGFLLKNYLFIYLAASGLSCITWDLLCGALTAYLYQLGLVVLRHVGSQSPDQGSNSRSLYSKADPEPPDHQEALANVIFMTIL